MDNRRYENVINNAMISEIAKSASANRIHIPAGVRAHARSRVLTRESIDRLISGVHDRRYSLRNRCLSIRD